jgi:hypothetical protein
MNVRFTPRALSEAERLKTSWRKSRPSAPNLFDDEVALAVEQLRTSPSIGASYPSRFGWLVRRLLMPKTKNHLYYVIREGEIVLLSVWGAPRGRGPKL